MTENFTITLDKEKVDINLLLMVDPSLPRVVRQLNSAYAFAGCIGEETVAVCLLEERRHKIYDLENLAIKPAYQNQGYGTEMLYYLVDFVRVRGGRFIEASCGNADIRSYKMFQQAGFRVVGVWSDYFGDDNITPQIVDGIHNRDMIRLRYDFREHEEEK